MPEVKIWKAVRALWARSALSSVLLRSNLPDSHFQTDGIATDYSAANIRIFHSCKEKMLLAPQKIGTAFPVTKVGDSAKLKLVLSGTCFQFPCSSLSKGKSLFMLK